MDKERRGRLGSKLSKLCSGIRILSKGSEELLKSSNWGSGIITLTFKSSLWLVLSLLSRSVMSYSLRPHRLQHARLPYSLSSPRICSNPCPLSQWCHPTSSSSVIPFCLWSFPASASFPMSCLLHQVARSLSFSISPSSEYSGLISFRITLLTCEIRWFPSANGKPLRKDRSTLSAATESQKHRSRSGQGTNSIYANSQVAKNQLWYYEFWARNWHPTPVPLPGKSHGWRSLVGYGPWGHKESDTTEQLHYTFTCSWITKMKSKAQRDTTCSICVWEECMFCSS